MFSINLNSILSRTSLADPDDVVQSKRGLNALGYYPEPEEDDDFSEITDDQLFDSILSFQKDNKLEADAVMKPNGPTVRKINNELKSKSTKKNKAIEREVLPPLESHIPKIPGTNIPDRGVEDGDWPLERFENRFDFFSGKRIDPLMERIPPNKKQHRKRKFNLI